MKGIDLPCGWIFECSSQNVNLGIWINVQIMKFYTAVKYTFEQYSNSPIRFFYLLLDWNDLTPGKQNSGISITSDDPNHTFWLLPETNI